MGSYVNLSNSEFIIVALIALCAGIVRGFSGFALSAIVMATAILILPPIELIPMLWWLEMTASLMMMRGGWADAHRPTAYGLVIGATLGLPIGLALTTSLPTATSKLVALSIIIVLAAAQLSKIRLDALNSKTGLYITGVVSGIVSGLANVGGMVVALYVLASDAAPRSMRGSLVLYLFLSAFTAIITQYLFGVMDISGVTRGLVFAVPAAVGVLIGQQIFTPRFEPYYRPFCLTLLLVLAGSGLIRLVLA